MSDLHFLGSTRQRSEETIAYTVDVTNVGSSPSVNSVTIFSKADYTTDLSSTNLSGSASVSGNVITSPLVTSLTDDTNYRVYVNYTISGETFVDYFDVICDDNEG